MAEVCSLEEFLDPNRLEVLFLILNALFGRWCWFGCTPCRLASSATVGSSRSPSSATFALNAASNFLHDFVIPLAPSVKQSRTLHTLAVGPKSGIHFSTFGGFPGSLDHLSPQSCIHSSHEGFCAVLAFDLNPLCIRHMHVPHDFSVTADGSVQVLRTRTGHAY